MHIRAEAVSVDIDGRRIFSDATLTCAPGTMTALVGRSGSGKTTLLHCLGLLQEPTGGRVMVNDLDTTGWRSGRRRGFWHDSASFVLQDYGIMEEESIAFNVTMRSSPFGSRTLGDRAKLCAALDATGLARREVETAAHLSGGEKQRLAVARAIYKDAAVVFVDEPTASLDAANRSHVVGLQRPRGAGLHRRRRHP